MDAAGAPALLHALEHSAFGLAIRQSAWAYPLANVGHVLAVVIFAAGVAIMDVRLLGAFRGSRLSSVLRDARRVTVLAFAGVALTGFVLFTAEASHLAANRVFQIKLGVIALGLANVLVLDRVFGARVAGLAPDAAPPRAIRAIAMASLGLWLAAVVLGRSIAYF